MASILDFGAIADGTTLNTTAIQKAIDATAAQGGGQVVVPAGTFVTGTLRLKDNIDLHLEPGAVLVASKNMDDYNPLDEYPQNWGSKVEQWRGAHLILAIGRKNVSITGRGVIDGSGDFFFEPPVENPPLRHNYAWAWGIRVSRDKEMLRPGQLLVFCECQNVLLSGITIRNSPCWCCYLIGCQDAVLEKLIIRNPRDAANTDGIDIDCCQNVMVSNCNIETGDDAITLRGHEKVLGRQSPCENVTITNCVLGCSVCAFRIGVGSGTIRNVAISNIAIKRAARGFLVQSAYSPNTGVDIYDICVSNIRFDNTANPVKILSGFPDTTATIHDLSFDGLYGNCYENILVAGQEKTQPHDIWFRNCRFHVVKPPVRLADQQDYPSHFLAITRAERIHARDVHFDRDEEAAPFWN